jgi:hypothetical protein
MSGWVALGHLVTLDDDMPGEWSNPQRSRALWLRSLAELIAKLLVFAVLVYFVLCQKKVTYLLTEIDVPQRVCPLGRSEMIIAKRFPLAPAVRICTTTY